MQSIEVMQSIKVRSRVGSDGILHLQVPVGIKNTDLEAIKWVNWGTDIQEFAIQT